MSILVILATFLAAGVEWVEALTIVLAVGAVKGWRSAFTGTGIAVVILAGLVAVFGVTLSAYVPIDALRTVIGAFLLLFGLKWLYKAILRSGGYKALHDEAAAYAETREHLLGEGRTGVQSLDWVGVGTAFNGVLLEGLEVVFIVIALGGLNSVPAATTGALASLVAIVALGIGFRRPLTAIPENTMKYVVGIMLTSFGTFFVGEGIGVPWWHADLSLLPLIAIYLVASILLVQYLKQPLQLGVGETAIGRAVRAAWSELWGLFVDDSALAMVAVVVVFALALLVTHDSHAAGAAGPLLVAGVLAAIVVALFGTVKQRQATARAKAPQQVEQVSTPGTPVKSA